MNQRNFYLGMGIGLAVGGCAMYALRPRKNANGFVARAVRTMGEVADAVSDMMGW